MSRADRDITRELHDAEIALAPPTPPTWPECDPSTVAPIATRKGKSHPDLRNHMPSRLVTQAEALARGWPYFYAAEPCREGHVAPRYSKSAWLCVNCERAKRGQPLLVGATSDSEFTGKDRPSFRAYGTLSDGKPYAWTAYKRKRLVALYIDTGDMGWALDELKVPPSEYYAEQERNEEFAAAVAKAAPLAAQVLEMRAHGLALAGNDKLLVKILTAKRPEYKPSLKVDVTQTPAGKLPDKKLRGRIDYLLKKRGTDIDGEVVQPTAPAALPAPDSVDDLLGDIT
jgi:hypothetical protein